MIARLRLWLASLLLLSAVFAGCGTPATVARKVVIGWDKINASAAPLARQALKSCDDNAVKAAKGGNVADARAALRGCAGAEQKVFAALHISLDATHAASLGIDAAEAVGAKDYSAALNAAFPAIRDLVDALNQLGVQLPLPAAPTTNGGSK